VVPCSSPSWPPSNQRGLMMPTSNRTRSQDRAYRIALERQHNAERIARDTQPHLLMWGDLE
jgi:hypothetical protein